MAVTRSMSKRQKLSDANGSTSWSDLCYDLLFKIMMLLGPIDFLAFSGVCKFWRSFALSNVSRFMESRRPMTLSISNGAEKACYLKDCEGRNFKTPLPHSKGRICVGLTCGYLILFGKATHDFWVFNPITRHELHFPNFHLTVAANPESLRGILVFSPSNHRWVLVISCRLSKIVSFSLSSTHWKHVGVSYPIRDIHFFKGKIYTLHTGPLICEMVFKPEPTMKLLEMKNFKDLNFTYTEFVSSDENLFVMTTMSADDVRALIVNVDNMIWGMSDAFDHAFLVSELKASAAVNPNNWAHPQPPGQQLITGMCYFADMWYFPHNTMKFFLLQD